MVFLFCILLYKCSDIFKATFVLLQIFYRLHLKVDEFFGGLFEKLGRFIARHPWKVIIFVSIVDIALGFGLLKLERDNSTEQYTPKDSTASKHRKLVSR